MSGPAKFRPKYTWFGTWGILWPFISRGILTITPGINETFEFVESDGEK